MTRRTVIIALTVLALLALTVSPALAGHDHYIVTPNGNCHQVAKGQTAIAAEGHGGYHRFHDNVHVGATADIEPGHTPPHLALGHGNSKVLVFKNNCGGHH